jgi:hypothetical protein
MTFKNKLYNIFCKIYPVMVLVGFGCMIFIILVTGMLIDKQRYCIIFLPISLLAFISFLFCMKKKIIKVFLLVSIVLNIISLIFQISDLSKDGDYKNVANYIMNNEKNSENIYIFASEKVIAIRFYYTGKNNLIPIPNEPSAVEYRPEEFIIRNSRQIEELFSKHKNEFIWVVSQTEDKNRLYDFKKIYLTEYLKQHYEVVKKIYFNGSEIFYCKKISASEFE